MFQIANNGDAACEGAVFVFQASKFAIPDTSNENVDYSVSPGVMKDSFKRSVVNIGPFNQVSYSLPPVPPKNGMTLTDMVVLSPSFEVPVSTNATTADGVHVNVNLNFSYSIPVTITLLLKDAPSISYSVDLECVAADSTEQAQEEYMGEMLGDVEKTLQKKNWFQRLAYRYLGRHHNVTVDFMKFEVEHIFDKDGVNAYMMKMPEGENAKLISDTIKYPTE
jgi:hypothetical protein